MACLESVVKSVPPETRVERPWIRFDFDPQGNLVEQRHWLTLVPSAYRSIAVNSQGSGECQAEVFAPDRDSDRVKLKLRLQISCPFGGESRVARLFYSYSKSPQEVFDRHLQAAAQAYVLSVGERSFFQTLFSEHLMKMGKWFEGPLANGTGLHFDISPVQLLSSPDPVLTLDLPDWPCDLANNYRAAPISLKLSLATDESEERLKILAFRRSEKEQVLRGEAEQRIKEFLKNCSFHRLCTQRVEVEKDLRANLAVYAKENGRMVSHLVLAHNLRIPAEESIPVSEEFELELADNTLLRLFINGSLRVDDAGQFVSGTDWSKRPDLWPALFSILKESARAELSHCVYTEFFADKDAYFARILTPVNDAAKNYGLSANLDLKSEWPYSWLTQTLALHHNVALQIGKVHTECVVSIDLTYTLSDSRKASIWPVDRLEYGFAMKTELDSCLSSQMRSMTLGEYYRFDSATHNTLERAITSALREKFGLAILNLRLKPSDIVSHEEVIPVRSDFELKLLDKTILKVKVAGSLTVVDIEKYVQGMDLNKKGDFWPELNTLLKETALIELSKCTYSKFAIDKDNIWSLISQKVKAKALSRGVNAELVLETEWPYDWLTRICTTTHIVRCEVGLARAKCELAVDISYVLAASQKVAAWPSTPGEFEIHLKKVIENCLIPILRPMALGDYYRLEGETRTKLEGALRNLLSDQLGLQTITLSLTRQDDAGAAVMLELMKHAPKFTIEHPASSRISYTCQYRVCDHTAKFGSNVATYPKTIEEATDAVEDCVREFLVRIPIEHLLKENNLVVKRELGKWVSKAMDDNFCLQVELLSWIPQFLSARPVYHSLRAQLDQSMEDIRQGIRAGVPKIELDEFRQHSALMAAEMHAQGELVPWSNLRVLGVDVPDSPSGAPGIKGLLDNGEVDQ